MRKIFSGVLLAVMLWCLCPCSWAVDLGYYYTLTGGGTGALDKTPADGLADGDMADVIGYAVGRLAYVYDDDSAAAESVPGVIAPDFADAIGTPYTGDGRWVLVKAVGLTLQSTVATGTAPLSVASTTVVANLNASYLEGHAASYFQVALSGGTDYLRPTTDVDDTPVDGELAQPSSSNWAYDITQIINAKQDYDPELDWWGGLDPTDDMEEFLEADDYAEMQTLLGVSGLQGSAITFTDADATPDVSGGHFFETGNTGATTITGFDGVTTDGYTIFVMVQDAVTTFDFTSSNLVGISADYTAWNDELLIFVRSDLDSKWHYVGYPKVQGGITISGLFNSIPLQYAGSRGSATTAVNTTETGDLYGRVKFADDVEANNYVDFWFPVPPDIDTTVDLTIKFYYRLGGADTGTHAYKFQILSIADSEALAGSPGDTITINDGADANGADGDLEITAETTLTGWKSVLTPGEMAMVRVFRDGDGTDASTVDSYPVSPLITYGWTQ